MTGSGSIETLTIEADDGPTLEAEQSVVQGPIASAVICHPHPLYGGNMHNNVVEALFAALSAADVAAIRFNFRGVGRSSGTHGDGVGERRDIEAAVAEAADRYPDLPLLVCGYSFGADVALTVDDPRVSGWFLVAPPLRVVAVDQMGAGADPRPKRIVTGSADDFRPPDRLPEVTAGWSNHQVTVADGANHFFATGLDVVASAVTAFATELAG